MSDNTAKPQNTKHTPPADAASPFFTFQQVWRTEMHRVLDESNAAMERGFGEWERNVNEATRFGQAQMRAFHEASRAMLAGARTVIG